MEFYYRVSPPIADFIGHDDSLKRAMRLSLMPLILSIQHRLAVYTGVLVMLMGMTFILFFEQRRIMREVSANGGSKNSRRAERGAWRCSEALRAEGHSSVIMPRILPYFQFAINWPSY